LHSVPKLIFRAYTNMMVCDSLIFVAGVGGGSSQHINRPKTKDCSHLCTPIYWHPVSKKKSLPRVGGVFLTRGKQEVVAPAQGEVTARQEAELVQLEVTQQPARANERAAQREATRQSNSALKGGGASRGCGMTRSHMTTNRVNGRQRHIKR
jgi:hypothetical protein